MLAAHGKGGEYFVQDLYGGADPRASSRRAGGVRIGHGTTCSSATFLRRPRGTRNWRASCPEFHHPSTAGPSFKADPARHGMPQRHGDRAGFRAQDDPDRQHRIRRAGTRKSVFTLLNYILPAKGVICPMHWARPNSRPWQAPEDFRRPSSACRAPARRRFRPIRARTLIGDDEHGWSDRGSFNFEGGCYAKTIKPARRGRAGNSLPPPAASAP